MRNHLLTTLFLLATLPFMVGCSNLFCPTVESLVVARDMPHEDIFVLNQGSCLVAGDPDRKRQGPFFSDRQCSTEVAFTPTPFKRFCKNNLREDRRTQQYVGNPKAWRLENPDAEKTWTLSQGSRLQISTVDQTAHQHRPFLRRVEYRTVESCSLGMHIYKSHIDGVDLKPAMFIYGGGWSRRGALSIVGMETLAPHLTDKGYIVFAPFHRVLDNTGDRSLDGPPECTTTTGKDIVADIEAAFDWIFQNGAQYGMDPDATQISTLGQSSGAHLAGYLAVHRKEAVDRALLLYPPTDLVFLAENFQEGGLYFGEFEDTEDILLDYTDSNTIGQIDLGGEFATSNSYPEMVNREPESFPSFFIIHGTDDEMVPVEQSTRLCEALDPRREPSKGLYEGGGDVLTCGEGNELHLIAGANHILDLRCFTGPLLRLVDLFGSRVSELETACPAGTSGTKKARAALNKALGRFSAQ